MTRRGLLQALAVLFAPRAAALGRIAPPSPESVPATAPVSINPMEFPHSHAGLEAWLRLPMQPLLCAGEVPPSQRATAVRIFESMPCSSALSFHYQGGSDPGTRRSAIPVLLFRKISPDLDIHEPAEKPVYLLAFCQIRNAPRVFRLDRMIAPDGADHNSISA